MTFGHYLTQWIIVTVVFGILAFLVNNFAPTRTLLPFAVAFAYLGILILLLGRALIAFHEKKE